MAITAPSIEELSDILQQDIWSSWTVAVSYVVGCRVVREPSLEKRPSCV